MPWEPTIAEAERQRRIQVSLWAYAYELESDSIVSDTVFDIKCYEIDLSIPTNDIEMDKWFRENFEPHTGQWVHNHPHLDRLEDIYNRIWRDR